MKGGSIGQTFLQIKKQIVWFLQSIFTHGDGLRLWNLERHYYIYKISD